MSYPSSLIAADEPPAFTLTRREGRSRFVIVVDEDIDVSDLQELIWAMLTRSDPATSIDIIRGAEFQARHILFGRAATAVTVAASCSGSCSDVMSTATPNRSRVVHDAAHANNSNGAMSGAWPMTCSSVQPPSNPSSSSTRSS